METNVQNEAPQKTHRRQNARGNLGVEKAAAFLRECGYTVTKPDAHPRGYADIVAKKRKETRHIQVTRISSRAILTRSAARNRIRGKPYCIEEIPNGLEVWVYDRDNRLYIFR